MTKPWKRAAEKVATDTLAAARLNRLGLSQAMKEALADLHIARLNKEKGRRAPLNDATLNALYRRGLVTGRTVAGYDGWVWSTTPKGKELAAGAWRGEV